MLQCPFNYHVTTSRDSADREQTIRKPLGLAIFRLLLWIEGDHGLLHLQKYQYFGTKLLNVRINIPVASIMLLMVTPGP